METIFDNFHYTLDTLILAKTFHTFEFIGKLAYLSLATLVSLHYNVYKYVVKSATLIIRYLN